MKAVTRYIAKDIEAIKSKKKGTLSHVEDELLLLTDNEEGQNIGMAEEAGLIKRLPQP